MNFKTVFDAAHDGYWVWSFPAFGLIFVALGSLLVFRPALMQMLLPSGLQGRARVVFGWFFLAFAIIWTISAFASTFADNRSVTSALAEGHYDVVEGVVADVVAAPPGHAQKSESFVVNGRRFFYFGYVVGAAFHQMASQGGPIRDGLHVRIACDGERILRLEIGE
jgi:hypothetical protein